MTELATQNRILVIDDEAMIRKLFKRFLERAGFEITCCSNGEDGIKAFGDDPADLVITDLSMPGMDGVEVIQELRQLDSEVPIFAISGDPNGRHEESLAKAAELGAVSIMSKPVELKALRERIDAALSDRRG